LPATGDVITGEDIYWSSGYLALTRKHMCEVTAIDTAGQEIDLIIKSQPQSYSSGVIEVLYDPA
jgi:hypothetical protein